MSVFEKISNHEPGYIRHGSDIGAARQFCEMSLWCITKLRLAVAEERYLQEDCTFDDLAGERITEAAVRLGEALREFDFVVKMLNCPALRPTSLGAKIVRHEKEKEDGRKDSGSDL